MTGEEGDEDRHDAARCPGTALVDPVEDAAEHQELQRENHVSGSASSSPGVKSEKSRDERNVPRVSMAGFVGDPTDLFDASNRFRVRPV
jgi:hypothetical protein